MAFEEKRDKRWKTVQICQECGRFCLCSLSKEWCCIHGGADHLPRSTPDETPTGGES